MENFSTRRPVRTPERNKIAPWHWLWLAVAGAAALFGCQSGGGYEPIRTADNVDLDRFAGRWYVIANIPTFLEREAYNAIEFYDAPKNGRIATTFTFNAGSFDGPRRTYRPTGFVNTSSAVWGMQFIWPFKAEYRIVHVDAQYQTTIVGRTKRDFLWVMARQPVLADAQVEALLRIAEEEGYRRDDIRMVPQQPLELRNELVIDAEGVSPLLPSATAAP